MKSACASTPSSGKTFLWPPCGGASHLKRTSLIPITQSGRLFIMKSAGLAQSTKKQLQRHYRRRKCREHTPRGRSKTSRGLSYSFTEALRLYIIHIPVQKASGTEFQTSQSLRWVATTWVNVPDMPKYIHPMSPEQFFISQKEEKRGRILQKIIFLINQLKAIWNHSWSPNLLYYVIVLK